MGGSGRSGALASHLERGGFASVAWHPLAQLARRQPARGEEDVFCWDVPRADCVSTRLVLPTLLCVRTWRSWSVGGNRNRTSSVSVDLGTPMWKAWAPFRSKLDDCAKLGRFQAETFAEIETCVPGRDVLPVHPNDSNTIHEMFLIEID